MHLLWVQQPIIAELYLSFIHTPRHYYRSLLLNTYGFKWKLWAIAIMTGIASIEIFLKYTDRLIPLWWVGPVLSHIYMTDFYIPNIDRKM